jgi:hypothetical protein
MARIRILDPLFPSERNDIHFVKGREWSEHSDFSAHGTPDHGLGFQEECRGLIRE